MNGNILIDADAIVAATNIHDSNHHKALFLGQKLEKLNLKKYMLNFVIAEIATVLSKKATPEHAHKFLEGIFSCGIEIIYIDEDFTKKTAELFNSYHKKGVSFVDCANLVVMEKLKIDKIFSFDKFYKDKLFTV